MSTLETSLNEKEKKQIFDDVNLGYRFYLSMRLLRKYVGTITPQYRDDSQSYLFHWYGDDTPEVFPKIRLFYDYTHGFPPFYNSAVRRRVNTCWGDPEPTKAVRLLEFFDEHIDFNEYIHLNEEEFKRNLVENVIILKNQILTEDSPIIDYIYELTQKFCPIEVNLQNYGITDQITDDFKITFTRRCPLILLIFFNHDFKIFLKKLLSLILQSSSFYQSLMTRLCEGERYLVVLGMEDFYSGYRYNFSDGSSFYQYLRKILDLRISRCS